MFNTKLQYFLLSSKVLKLFLNTAYMVMGDSRKYPYLYLGRLLGFPKGRGGGGSLNWNSEGMGGIYDWKSEGMGDFTGGISGVERVE